MMESGGRLLVYLLGGFEIYYEGVPLQIRKRLTSKPLQLLQLLLYHREAGVSRRAVIEALFGEETEIDETNSLNATVSQLRRILRETRLPEGNYIHVRLDRYYFDGPIPVWVDTEEALRLRQTADLSAGSERTELLYRLCELYRGRFLPELDGESWAEIARASCQRIYHDSLEELCGTLKEQRAYEEILRLTGLAAKRFPFDEWQVWQQECLLAQGRVREACELYRQVEKLYMSELDARPPERMRARFRKPEKESWRKAESIGSVQKWLRQSEQDGPSCIPYPGFLQAYQLIGKLCGMADTPYCLMLCTLSNADGRVSLSSEEFHAAMEQLELTLERSLRRDDVFTRYSRSQFLVILLGAGEENLGVISERISERFHGTVGGRKLQLACQVFPTDVMAQPECPGELSLVI